MQSSELIYQSGVFGVAPKALNCVGARLVEHGLLVAYVVLHMQTSRTVWNKGFDAPVFWRCCTISAPIKRKKAIKCQV